MNYNDDKILEDIVKREGSTVFPSEHFVRGIVESIGGGHKPSWRWAMLIPALAFGAFLFMAKGSPEVVPLSFDTISLEEEEVGVYEDLAQMDNVFDELEALDEDEALLLDISQVRSILGLL